MLMSEAITMPRLVMITSTISKESLARDTHTHTNSHKWLQTKKNNMSLLQSPESVGKQVSGQQHTQSYRYMNTQVCQLPQDSITESRNVDVILMLCCDLLAEPERKIRKINPQKQTRMYKDLHSRIWPPNLHIQIQLSVELATECHSLKSYSGNKVTCHSSIFLL